MAAAGRELKKGRFARPSLANDLALAAAFQRIEALLQERSILRQRVDQLTQEEAQARLCAHYDELTGLPNRRLLQDRFNQAAARRERRGSRLALLFLDLDGFKSVNDALGHSAGDLLLKQVAARLTSCIRRSDTVCRFGGDEFVILLPDLDRQESAVAAVSKLHSRLAAPYLVEGSEIRLTASIGLAMSPVDGVEYAELIRKSDTVMFLGKARAPARPVEIGPVRGAALVEARQD
jgi:diguanylate cyclase (GGDEF)-like protein